MLVIFINQIRMKIGVMFGNPETTTGGNALKFYASVRLDIRRIGSIKRGEEVVGNETRVKVVKNKVAPPFREAVFDILYGEGISREGEIIELGVNHQHRREIRRLVRYNGDKIGQGKDNAREFLREHPDIAAEIEAQDPRDGRRAARRPRIKGERQRLARTRSRDDASASRPLKRPLRDARRKPDRLRYARRPCACSRGANMRAPSSTASLRARGADAATRSTRALDELERLGYLSDATLRASMLGRAARRALRHRARSRMRSAAQRASHRAAQIGAAIALPDADELADASALCAAALRRSAARRRASARARSASLARAASSSARSQLKVVTRAAVDDPRSATERSRT